MLYGLWHLGNDAENIPPLKSVTGNDYSLAEERKRHSDVRFLMLCFKDCLVAAEANIEKPSQMQVTDMYIKLSETFLRDGFPLNNEPGHIRRNGQMIWTTVVKFLRKRSAYLRGQVTTE